MSFLLHFAKVNFLRRPQTAKFCTTIYSTALVGNQGTGSLFKCTWYTPFQVPGSRLLTLPLIIQ